MILPFGEVRFLPLLYYRIMNFSTKRLCMEEEKSWFGGSGNEPSCPTPLWSRRERTEDARPARERKAANLHLANNANRVQAQPALQKGSQTLPRAPDDKDVPPSAEVGQRRCLWNPPPFEKCGRKLYYLQTREDGGRSTCARASSRKFTLSQQRELGASSACRESARVQVCT